MAGVDTDALPSGSIVEDMEDGRWRSGTNALLQLPSSFSSLRLIASTTDDAPDSWIARKSLRRGGANLSSGPVLRGVMRRALFD